jgi:uncharacterized protein
VILAKIFLDREGRVLGFEAAGHAEGAALGKDIACAAFSVLARTAFRALEALPGIKVKGLAPAPGSLSFEVLRPAEDAGRAAGIADFLVTGMSDLARDYPGAVALTIERDWEE